MAQLVTRVQSLGPTEYKEKTNTCKLPSDSHEHYCGVDPFLVMVNTTEIFREFNEREDIVGYLNKG